MPIDITCPGCRTRFKVSEKFAGQKGPCPKCKTVIQIPAKGEEVVVHAPEGFGPKNAAGVAVLKPIARKETKVTPVMLVGVVSSIFVVLLVALLLRGMKPIAPWILGLGAFAVAPPVVWAGYAFLRDQELEAHRGRYLAIRVSICSAVYALLWAVYAWLPGLAFHLDTLELFHLLFIIPPIAAVGGLAALATLDLDFGTGVLHYGFYLLVTVLLCFVIGLDLLGSGQETAPPAAGQGPAPVVIRGPQQPAEWSPSAARSATSPLLASAIR